ncbi:DNA-binding protein [Acinetobacter genomosp. 33YU]|nr:DNA-binding protein [Acinetobacter genomosp. 33YU]
MRKSMLILQQWLTEQRQAKNLSLEQLADRLNRSFSYVQDVESGQYQLDVVEYLFYCKALDINPNQGLELIQSNLTSI